MGPDPAAGWLAADGRPGAVLEASPNGLAVAVRWQPTEEVGPNRLECPHCEKTRKDKKRGPLVLPLPTRRGLLAARLSAPVHPWWQLRVQHAMLYPAMDRTRKA